jgi:DNA-binding transcriptional ArsR family regulator
VVRAELDKVRDGRPLPAVLAPLYEDPAGHLPAVVEQFASGGLARVLADLWREAPANHSDPLAALVGRTRARLLATLGLPRTTSQLAVQFGLSPAAVSQHLKVLKETGLMTARRRGRMVLYQPTAAATTLLEAASSNQQAG